MDLRSELFNSEGAVGGKDLLLRRCRDTIQILEEELDKYIKSNAEHERKLRELTKIHQYTQEEIHEKDIKISNLDAENTELEAKYQSVLKQALSIQDQNEILKVELEHHKKKLMEYEGLNINNGQFIEEIKREINMKNEMIKELDESLVLAETKVRMIDEENEQLKNELDKYIEKYERMLKENREFHTMLIELQRKNDEMVKDIVKVSQDNMELIEVVKVWKEKGNMLENECENKARIIKEYIVGIEDTRNKALNLEKTNTELVNSLNFANEEIKKLKGKVFTLELDLKELSARKYNDIERLNITLETKSNFFNKEDSRKLQMISQLEFDLKTVKTELGNLTTSDTELQSRYKNLHSKYTQKKKQCAETISENQKLATAIIKFEEKCKLTESNSVKDITSLKNDISLQSQQYQQDLNNQEHAYSVKISELQSKLVDAENKFKKKLEKQKVRVGDLLQTIKNKDEEIIILNDDRAKLQHALSDLEQKVIEISRNLENSVADCWKLSSELTRSKDNQKDETIRLNSHYKQQISKLEEELALQSENFNKRVMKKVQDSYEKNASFKDYLRKETDILENQIRNFDSQCQQDLLLSVHRLQAMINTFST
ncbi:hypothetical protein SteCoe_25045 [Stentor coeruleus]|uniref:Uncharacterized protein n=1 Tax=Stentor coeruleus TaxID=5963 RepID=A0A1R2BG52_9CILI|nr:hypothetical protein SteCoe_25045 [Stentor coeruleus]